MPLGHAPGTRLLGEMLHNMSFLQIFQLFLATPIDKAGRNALCNYSYFRVFPYNRKLS
jgi:hypothetical protein